MCQGQEGRTCVSVSRVERRLLLFAEGYRVLSFGGASIWLLVIVTWEIETLMVLLLKTVLIQLAVAKRCCLMIQ